MIYVSHRHRIVYFPLPKIASSSLKTALYILDTGRKFESFKRGNKTFSVHDLYDAEKAPVYKPYYAAYFSFTVVREPLSRLLSVHRHRIEVMKDMETPETLEKLTSQGLSNQPDINFFLLNVEAYMAASWMIDHHASPQRAFLPHNYEQIETVLPLEQIASLSRLIEKRTGQPFTLPNINETNSGDAANRVSQEAIDHVEKVFAADFQLYRRAVERRDWLA